MDLAQLIARIPAGWSRVRFAGHPYGLSRRDRVEDRVITVWAEQLDGTDTISANLWSTSGGWQLRPCEMPAEKVLTFLQDWR